MATPQQQFSALTIELTKSLSKDEKKDYGIFITPLCIIDKLVSNSTQYAKDNNISIQTILEPACGTCAIVNYCDTSFKSVTIDAVEFNEKMYEAIKDLPFSKKNKVTIHQSDFITYKSQTIYDLTISNPPYFVCKKGYKVPQEYTEYIIGRPNIFGIFILKQLSMTRVGGLAAFIIPKSFMNSSYYGKIRDYIKATCKIVLLEDYALDNDFIDTEQATFGLILHKINEIIARFMSDKKINANNETGNSITEYNNFRDADNSSENITYLSCEKNKDGSICCTKVNNAKVNNAKVNENDPILFL